MRWLSAGARMPDDDAELDGRDLICDRLANEVGWIRQCAAG